MMMAKSTKLGGGVVREPEEIQNGKQGLLVEQRKPLFTAARHITRPKETAGTYTPRFHIVTDAIKVFTRGQPHQAPPPPFPSRDRAIMDGKRAEMA